MRKRIPPPSDSKKTAAVTLSEEDVIDQALKAAYSFGGNKGPDEVPAVTPPPPAPPVKTVDAAGGRVGDGEQQDLDDGDDGYEEEGSESVLHDKRVVSSGIEGEERRGTCTIAPCF